MTEQEFINKKMPILISEGYKRNQAYMIAKSLFSKEHAQQGQFQGDRYNVPQGIDYTFNPQMPTPQNPFENTGYANYAQDLNQRYPAENNTYFGQVNPFSNYTVPNYKFDTQNTFSQYNQQQNQQEAYNKSHNPDDYIRGDVNGDGVVDAKDKPKTQYNNEVNIYNPYTGVDLNQSLMYAGQGFGEGDPWKAGLGTSLSLLKGARGFMSGYANGKASRQANQANKDALYEQNKNYVYSAFQQGGSLKLTNADALTGQFVADEGAGNVNMENDEFIKRNTGQVQQVVGEPHVKNGKEAEGVDVSLEDGDKTLSNTKILPIGAKNAKELKDRYNISVKAKDTFASVQKKVDSKIGYKKETEELASWIEKFGDNEKLKDKTTKELNAPIIEKNMLASKAKIEALNEVRGMVFEDLYERQERIPKRGRPGDLFTDSGKLVTEKNKGVAQQGGTQNGTYTDVLLNKQVPNYTMDKDRRFGLPGVVISKEGTGEYPFTVMQAKNGEDFELLKRANWDKRPDAFYKALEYAKEYGIMPEYSTDSFLAASDEAKKEYNNLWIKRAKQQGGTHYDPVLKKQIPNNQNPIEFRWAIKAVSPTGDEETDYIPVSEGDYNILSQERDDTTDKYPSTNANERFKVALPYLKKYNRIPFVLSKQDYEEFTPETNAEYDKLGWVRQQGGGKDTPFKKYLKKYPNTASEQDTIEPLGGSFDVDIRFKKGQREELNKAYDKTYSNYDKDFERFETPNTPKIRRQEGGEQQDQAKQIILAYAEASGQDPQALAEQIGQMQPEEQQQALQQMAQELQNGQEQGEQNQSMQEEQQEMQQQGGLMEMASKYGISPERAQELVSMQQGGEKIAPQRPIKFIQAVSTEGYRDNNHLVPGDYQKVYYVDPSQAKVENQDYEYLTNSGYDELKRMNNYRLYMEQKNKNTLQNNQITSLQQGGKIYAQQGTPREDAEKRKAEKLSEKEKELKEFENLLQPNKYGQIEAPLQHAPIAEKNLYDLSEQDYQDRIEEYYKVIPHLAKKYFPKKDGKYVFIDKATTNAFQKDYDKYVDKAFTKFKDDYTPEQLDTAKGLVKFKPELKEDSSARLYDSKMGLFTSSRSGVKAPILPKERLDELNKKGIYHLSTALDSNELTPEERKLIQGEVAKYDDYYMMPIDPQKTAEAKTTTETSPEIVKGAGVSDVNTVPRNYVPSFPVDLRMPPSALSPLNKPYVPFTRLEPIKATAEPMLAEQERMRQTDLERINQTGLSAQQMEALSASGLASSQMASNDAIGKVENFNAQNQFQTDQFNIGQRTKEDMTNAQFSQKYQDQMLGSMANTERDWRNFYTEGNLQNRMNYNDIENANLLNAKNEQYAVVPGQGVIFKNNQAQDMPVSMPTTQKAFDDMTAEERWNLLNNLNKKADVMKKYKSSTT